MTKSLILAELPGIRKKFRAAGAGGGKPSQSKHSICGYFDTFVCD
jgi:hypothetical protein